MNETNDQLSPVELLAQEFLDRQQRGEKPTIRDYCERHPELADEIREVFEAVAMVEELKPNSDDVTGEIGQVAFGNSRRPSQVGDYRILREVGRGGMGVVYEAEQESLRRRVALKVMPRNTAGDEKSLLRFQREARAAARMHHTNIVPVFEVGEDDVHVFYAMQLIQGQALDLVVDDLKRMRTEQMRIREKSGIKSSVDLDRSRGAQHSLAESLVTGQFQQEQLLAGGNESQQPVTSATVEPSGQVFAETVDQEAGSATSAVLPGNTQLSNADSSRDAYFRSVAEIGLQTAQALAYAHARGIIHRDIKPSNLILDSAGVVWVTDFGLAKTSDESMTHTGDILGTIRYMSPERFKGQCDGRADVYSLGLTLYELLVLQPAFVSPDRMKLIKMVTSSDPPTPRALDKRIPRDLETIVLKCADKDARRRYQSADELCEDLERFIQDEPIKARRISLFERVSRWSRHNKGLAASLAVITALLLAINIAGPIFTWRMAAMNEQLELNNSNLLLATNRAEKLATIAVRESKNAKRNEIRADAERESAHQILYSADMKLAQHSLANRNLGRASMVIDRHWPQAGQEQEDLRCWAWRHLWQRTQGDQLKSMGPLDSAAFTIDWTPDHSAFAVGELFGPVSLWDVATQQKVATLDPGFRNRVVAFSPLGKYFVYPGYDQKIHLWDWASRSQLSSLVSGAETSFQFVPSLSFSADERRLCAVQVHVPREGGGRGHLDVWDLNSNAVLFSVECDLDMPSVHHGMARLSPDGAIVYSGEAAGRLKAYEVDSGELLFDISCHDEGLTALAVSPNGELLATGSGYKDTSVKVWRATDGQFVGSFEGHTGWIPWLEFTPDGKSVASASADQTARIWDVETFTESRVLRGHLDQVYGLSISNDGKSVVTACKDGTMQLWDAEPNTRIANYVNRPRTSRIHEFSPDSRSLLTLSENQEVVVLDAVTLEQQKVLPELGQPDKMKSSPDGRHLLVTGDDGSQIYDFATARVVHRFDSQTATFLEDQDVLAVLTETELEYWDTATWQKTHSVERDDSIGFGWMISPAGDTIVSKDVDTSRGPTMQLTISNHSDTGSWTRKVITPHKRGFPSGYAFSPDGTLLATSSRLGDVQITDLATGRCIHRMRGHISGAHSICFSPDGTRIATGGNTQQDAVIIWNVANGQEVVSLEADCIIVKALSFSPDGNAIAATSKEGLHVWHAPSFEQIKNQKLSRESSSNQPRTKQSALSIEARDLLISVAKILSEQIDEYARGGDHLELSLFRIQSIIEGDPRMLEEFKKLRPDDLLLSVCLGRNDAWQQDWASAVSRYSMVADDTPSELWYEYAAVLLLANQTADYDRLLKRLLEHCEAAGDDNMSFVAAHAAAISSDAPFPVNTMVQLAEEKAIANPYDGRYQHVAALANYRAGKLDEALEWTRPTNKSSREWPPQMKDLVKTLVYLELGKTKEANTHWTRVQDWRKEADSGMRNFHLASYWLESQLLIREIEEQLKRPATSGK